MLGACPTSYSARASAGVGTAPEPSQPGPGDMVEEPRSPSPDEVADQVEQDFLASKHCQSVSMTPEAGPSPSSPPPSGEAELLILEEDLRLSSESDLDITDAGEPASEPPPKDPPSEDGWFDLGRGEPKSELKGSALGEVCDHGVHSEAPVPSPRINRPKPQSSVGFGLEGVDFV